MKIGIRNLQWLTIIAGIFFLTASGNIGWGQETGAAGKKEDPKAEFEAMKAEWEKVRDQQIAMIQEKEAQLEEIKENLFNQTRLGAIPAPPVSTAAALEKKIAELKEANRRLAEEVSSLNAQNTRLKELKGVMLEPPAIADLQRQKAELEAQKEAFLKERKKFFQEITRQKEKLQEQQVSPEGSKAVPEERARANAPAV